MGFVEILEENLNLNEDLKEMKAAFTKGLEQLMMAHLELSKEIKTLSINSSDVKNSVDKITSDVYTIAGKQGEIGNKVDELDKKVTDARATNLQPTIFNNIPLPVQDESPRVPCMPPQSEHQRHPAPESGKTNEMKPCEKCGFKSIN